MSSSEESDTEDKFLNQETVAADIFGEQDDDFVPGVWKEVPPYDDTIAINGVEDFLLAAARKEAEVATRDGGGDLRQ